MDKNKIFKTKTSSDWDHTDSFGTKRNFKVSLTGYYDDKERRIIIEEDLITSPLINKHEDSYLYETIFNRMKFELKETIKLKQKNSSNQKA